MNIKNAYIESKTEKNIGFFSGILGLIVDGINLIQSPLPFLE
jgi:hypothetical protein